MTVVDREEEEEEEEEVLLFPRRKVDVVEQSRLPPKPCTDTQTPCPPGVLNLHPSRPSPEEKQASKQTQHPSSESFFHQSRLFPHVLPSGRMPHPGVG